MRPRYTSCYEHYANIVLSPDSSADDIALLPSKTVTSSSSTATITTTSTEMAAAVQHLSLRGAPNGKSMTTSDIDASRPSPFLGLPAELRLQIYSLVVLPREPNDLLPDYAKVHRSAQDAFDYDRRQRGTDRFVTADLTRPTLLIRTIDGPRYHELWGHQAPHIRATYSVRGDRFRARTMPTTYHAVNGARLADRGAASLLGVNSQLHAEAAELLYSTYNFDFDTHVEAVVPFLADLTPFARSRIAHIRLVKRALAYEKEFDRAEWATALRYLADPANGMQLRRLELGVVAGRPGPDGWRDVPTYEARDFAILKETDGMEWMRPLLELRGLQELDVQAVVEHCPPATNSMAMANFIRFSASIEAGFADFLRAEMLKSES